MARVVNAPNIPDSKLYAIRLGEVMETILINDDKDMNLAQALGITEERVEELLSLDYTTILDSTRSHNRRIASILKVVQEVAKNSTEAFYLLHLLIVSYRQWPKSDRRLLDLIIRGVSTF